MKDWLDKKYMSKKVLMFGTYPIVSAQHGGQKRVEAILDQYKRSGFKAKYVGVFDSRFYPEHTADDIPIHFEGDLTPLQIYASDMLAGKAIGQRQDTKAKVLGMIRDFKPDIIEVEQCFPYMGLKQVLNEIGWKGQLIYSSQNIEYELKAAILDDSEVEKDEQRQAVSELTALEKELTRSADLVVACTESDLQKYESMGARATVCAPNGIKKQKADHDTVAKWRQTLGSMQVNHPIIFVGSAHPPNVQGFMEMIGSKFGFLPPDTRIFIIGGVSDLIKQRLEEDYRGFCAPLRLEYLGRTSDKDLTALLSLAEIIILPITEGGGSNLKTAEAILSRKKVVTTQKALRSYDQYVALPNIYSAVDGEGFRNAITKALHEDIALTPEQTKLSETVQWDYTLKQMMEKVKTI